MKKKKYEAPAMQVFELKARQSLLAGSDPKASFKGVDKEQEWDIDSDEY